IDAVLSAHPAVRQGLSMLREDTPGDKRLVAYVAPVDGAGALTTAELREHLRRTLPDYMMPSAVVFLDALPCTPHGKVDRKALPPPDAQPEGEPVAARTKEEAILVDVFRQALNLKQVGIHDNFFEIGGDSILTIHVVTRASQAGLRLSPKQIFQHPTIAALAKVAGQVTSPLAEQGLLTGDVPLSPVQRWFFARDRAAPHHFNQGVLFEAKRPLDPAALEEALAALAAQHDALRLR